MIPHSPLVSSQTTAQLKQENFHLTPLVTLNLRWVEHVTWSPPSGVRTIVESFTVSAKRVARNTANKRPRSSQGRGIQNRKVYVSWVRFKLKQRGAGGGGYLNPTISQRQYILYSLNLNWIQLPPPHHRLNGTGFKLCSMYCGWEIVGFKYPPYFKSRPWGGGKYYTLSAGAGKMLDSNTPLPCLNPDLHRHTLWWLH